MYLSQGFRRLGVSYTLDSLTLSITLDSLTVYLPVVLCSPIGGEEKAFGSRWIGSHGGV